MGQAFISASTLMAAFAYMVAILDIKANEIMCCNDLITACMHKVATLDDQEQLHPHVQIYCIFTASILISACANVVAILDGQLEQLHTHAQIYHIFTASILISVCAYWRHPSTCRTPIMMCMYQSHRTIVPHSHSGLTQRLQ